MDALFPTITLDQLTGQFRRIAGIGPVYEILGPAGIGADGQWSMRIHLVESDEQVDYPLRDVLEDPIAH